MHLLDKLVNNLQNLEWCYFVLSIKEVTFITIFGRKNYEFSLQQILNLQIEKSQES